MICVADATLKLALVPWNFTAVAPSRPVPVKVTTVPTGPEVGEKPVMTGAGMTVKLVALVALPPAVVTATAPVVAPPGTVAVICVGLTTLKDAGVPLNVTELAPSKAEPVRVTEVPTGPEAGRIPEMVGAGMRVKLAGLAALPPGVVTEMVPVVAPTGTVAVICVAETTLKLALECRRLAGTGRT